VGSGDPYPTQPDPRSVADRLAAEKTRRVATEAKVEHLRAELEKALEFDEQGLFDAYLELQSDNGRLIREKGLAVKRAEKAEARLAAVIDAVNSELRDSGGGFRLRPALQRIRDAATGGERVVDGE